MSTGTHLLFDQIDSVQLSNGNGVSPEVGLAGDDEPGEAIVTDNQCDPSLAPFQVPETVGDDELCQLAPFLHELRSMWGDTITWYEAAAPRLTTQLHAFKGGEINRADTRATEAYAQDPTDDLCRAITRLVGDIADDPMRLVAIREIMDAHFAGILPPALLSELVQSLERDAILYHFYRSHSVQVVPEVRVAISGDTAREYQVLKAIGSTQGPSPSRDNDSMGIGRTFIGMFYLAQEATGGGEVLLEQLAEQAAAGTYDIPMARDVLQFVVEHPAEITFPAFSRLANCLSFARLCAPEANDSELIDRLSKGVSTWPAEARMAYAELRDSFVTQVRKSLGRVQDQALDQGYVSRSGNNQHDFEESLEGVMNAVLRGRTKMLKRGEPQIPQNLTVRDRAALVEANVLSARRRKAAAQAARLAAQAATNGEAASSDETGTKRPLVVVDQEGNLYEPGSDRYARTVEGYLKKHIGAKGLREDVEAALAYMARLDFSKGIVRGVKTYNSTMDFGALGRRPIYAFKPADAVNLPKTHQLTRKLRVIFTLSDEHLGIVEILDRPDVPLFEKRHGLGSGAS